MSGEVRDPAVRRFFRLSGGGNDFIALLEDEGRPSTEEIRKLCRRGLSLGTDGLLLLSPGDRELGMRYFNRDGSEGALCLNGARCAAQLGFFQGWGEDPITLTSSEGRFTAWRRPDHTIEIAIPVPARPAVEMELPVDDQMIRAWSVDTGVPHLVVWWHDALESAPVDILGPRLRSHPQIGEAGANVNLVKISSPHQLEIRTYERGVEAETLACGTGVLAAVAAGLAEKILGLPAEVLTAGGFTFTVEGEVRERHLLSWTQRGDARILAHGELLPGALVSPK